MQQATCITSTKAEIALKTFSFLAKVGISTIFLSLYTHMITGKKDQVMHDMSVNTQGTLNRPQYLVYQSANIVITR